MSEGADITMSDATEIIYHRIIMMLDRVYWDLQIVFGIRNFSNLDNKGTLLFVIYEYTKEQHQVQGQALILAVNCLQEEEEQPRNFVGVVDYSAVKNSVACFWSKHDQGAQCLAMISLYNGYSYNDFYEWPVYI
ncbi:hypothetical protein PHYBLDRAFT_165091 [Phycomyces blakesleeanus NRRL 1555(-)]|uniref:Uncharacterized protein n=1 Tax=Phycomyces blakesleeanus (strain ATCC 8743b / DSM 1359 / FGSC 10004 / NBRC 33097 / NRRL 1555) TaxID=763407 RepID=A0A162UND7_PHYB8|nr:hypothetical protein PHYBLDRAFT_165091 [Phycomyces blakesleeanus NRRL 1555(-)]OAD76563.1 hypothetical protein PHYBLDRAFT_165091 [Phycomyces blakesleeanus NRRL 1555(-)]|eukprot:XP_018294603.1 hypothetical protein PHYBLDRAFT_165091 [Phycomyces blakesleeanus NRRL 1555(-)]